MLSLLLLLPVPLLPVQAAETAAALAQSIRSAGLDGEECYRVRDLNFTREDLKVFLTDGFLIFSKPVAGRRLAAVFSADTEGGDGELILMPPHRGERQSLGSFTGSPNLNEHFKTVLFLFPGETGEDLLKRARESGRKSTEMGLLLSGQFSSVTRNIAESFQMRLVEDLLSESSDTAIFFAAIGGTRPGNFDVVIDPKAREQIVAGQFTARDNSSAFDVWTSFEARSIRMGQSKPAESAFAVSDYRIDARLDDRPHMTAVTRLKMTPARPARAFAFQVSDRVTIGEVSIDGRPVEMFDLESLRASAIRGVGAHAFLLVTPENLEPGRTFEVEFHHEGDVVEAAGNGVYTIAARASWYPNHGAEFTNFDLNFRYPKRLTLVATGEVAEDRTEGDVRVTRRRTSGPVRFAGFNLGEYEKVSTSRNGYTIEVYANRRAEPSLERRPTIPSPQPASPPRGIRRFPEMPISPPPSPPPINPVERLNILADDVAGAFDFMSKEFGPPPLKTLTVAPIPGNFGQGFPGLVYLSTMSYLTPAQRPEFSGDKARQVFFSDLLAAHEVAHQWWGNLVTTANYQDAWFMEALANYSALLYLEKRKGSKALDSVLEDFRGHLLSKMTDGKTVESISPITRGPRLASAEANAAWRTVEYEKGAWVIHMLRRRLGDEAFFKILNEMCRRYAYKPVSTEDFRRLIEANLPPGFTRDGVENFFESWIYASGIPVLKVASTTRGKVPALKITGTVSQADVDEDFSVEVPVEVQFASGPPAVKWVRTANEPISFTISAKRVPARVVIPASSVLYRR